MSKDTSALESVMCFDEAALGKKKESMVAITIKRLGSLRNSDGKADKCVDALRKDVCGQECYDTVALIPVPWLT